jgi:hypothetical protein
MHRVLSHRHLGRTAAVALACLAVAAGAALPATAASSPWTIVPSADPSAQAQDKLTAVAVVNGSDVWAVGKSGVASSIIENWNGSTWTLSSHPNPGTSVNQLNGVAATSASDVWAVGQTANTGGGTQPLIEHFNGTGWSSVPAPAVTSNDELLAVAALSPTNAWAVGTSNFASTLIEHWNGSTWSVVTGPGLPGAHTVLLNSVAIDNANDIWAVGQESLLDVNGGFCNATLAEHFNGTSWSTVATPQSTTTCNVFSSVTAASAVDAWAVGNAGGASLTEHWNGASWSVVSNQGGTNATLNGVTELSPSDVWAVGNGNRSGSGTSLTLHWNGTSWTTVASPGGSQGGALSAVANVPSTSTLWAVGNQINNAQTNISQTLILRNTTG